MPGLCMSNSATTKVMMFYVLISLATSKKTSGMQGRIRLILMFFCHQNGFDELEVQEIKYHSCKNFRRKISCA